VLGWIDRRDENSSEQRLIQRAQRGDRTAFTRLVEMHEDRVYRLASRVVGEQDAGDVAQRTFLRCWQALPSFRQDSAFGTWLYRIASNLCLDHLRQAGRFRTVPLEDDALIVDTSEAAGPADQAERRERAEALQWALDELPSEYRLILALRISEGLSYGEIAAQLGLSPTTVGTRLFRARERLRRLLAERLGEGSNDLR
jgi:RNA polymerase sigma-70 factor (ECF subfamily)